MPEHLPYVKQLQMIQPSPHPTYSWRLDSDPTIPKNPLKEAQSGSAAGERTPPHRLTTTDGIAWSNKKGKKKKITQNQKQNYD